MSIDLTDLRMIATYLNVMVMRDDGDLAWLTETNASFAISKNTVHDETQCLYFTDALWLANNVDADSTTQQTFLEMLGIDSAAALKTHVTTYGARVLKRMTMKKDAIQPSAFKGKPKEVRLHEYLQKPAKFPAKLASYSKCGLSEFSLTGTGSPASSNITFVHGDYATAKSKGGTCHAEQKLIAALGIYLKSAKSKPGEIFIAGVKPACVACSAVLKELEKVVSVKYVAGSAVKEGSEWAQKKSDVAAVLDFDTYFPKSKTSSDDSSSSNSVYSSTLSSASSTSTTTTSSSSTTT
jgi:hypothetical protein